MLQYECLVIPDFGAFLTREFSGGVNRDNHFFFPSEKQVAFNGLLIENDGVLANFISLKKQILYSDAIALIKKEVLFLKNRLEKTPVIVDQVGELSTSIDNKIIFKPYNAFNFELNSFGLSSYTKTKYDSSKSKIPNYPPKINNMENSNKDPLSFTPEKAIKKMTPLKYAAIGIIAIIFSGSAFYFLDQYISNQRIISTELGQNKIKENVQQAKFDVGTLSPIEINFNSKPPVLQSNYPSYSVIAGSFRNLMNAEKLFNSLKNEGYEAKIVEISTEGLHRVAYGVFNSKKEALNLFYFIRYTLEEEAWYLANK